MNAAINNPAPAGLPVANPNRPLPSWLMRWLTFSLMGLAMAVSMGAALVSLFKFFLLLGFLTVGVMHARGATPMQPMRWPQALHWVLALWAWMVVSAAWSSASTPELVKAFDRYSRLLVLPVAWYLLQWTQSHAKVLRAFALGQALVLASSYLLLMKLSVPWATAPDGGTQYGVVFASTLEQPIMMGLFAMTIFHCAKQIFNPRWMWLKWPLIVLTLANVLFFSMGRTGYVTGALALFLITWHLFLPRYRWLAGLLPLLALVTAFVLSPRVQMRMLEVRNDVVRYVQSDSLTHANIGSQGARLDYWSKSIDMVRDHPIVGVGLGAWRTHYMQYGGLDNVNPPTNPHQQFLLVAAEGGVVGLALLLYWLWSLWRPVSPMGRDSTSQGHGGQGTSVVFRHAGLRSVVVVAVAASLFNCPLYGVGIGEMLLLLFAVMMSPTFNQRLSPS